MLEDGAVRRTIEQIVRQRLSGTRVTQIGVKADYDRDGDPIFRITIVFDSKPTAQDVEKMAGLVGHIRSGLDDANADRFPLVSFISKREASKLKLAAA